MSDEYDFLIGHKTMNAAKPATWNSFPGKRSMDGMVKFAFLASLCSTFKQLYCFFQLHCSLEF